MTTERQPFFSIITVTYQAEKVIERTMESVRKQSYTNLEHVIVDGASTDGTLALLQPYKTTITHLLSEPDNGIYDAMNKAITLASGDYLWFLNAGDEIYSPETVQLMADLLVGPHLPDVVYGETAVVDKEGRFLHMRRLKAPKRLSWRSFSMGMLVCHQSFIVHKRVCLQYDLKYRFSADFDWCIRVMRQSTGIFNTHLTLSNYLNEGATTENMKASLKERYRIMCQYYGTLPTLVRHIWFAVRFFWDKQVHHSA